MTEMSNIWHKLWRKLGNENNECVCGWLSDICEYGRIFLIENNDGMYFFVTVSVLAKVSNQKNNGNVFCFVWFVTL